MPKEDIKQINRIAKEFKMTIEERKGFGKFIETEKKLGYGGTKNEQGDFTYEELLQKAMEFLEIE
ncbi:hypothetical protein C7H19_10300 [Aphanothece hegewaldii CCALA 016]|uniref:Uncharacterized protein n=1 Tax=Aphanothece hegewaldii CCALA 016 TaxID=2107694 RepID=A0A2T1LYS1_9CHRO|nr:hypothetical protein [Aphanothece hegewaldii]PSF37547.1 hypothetical protein C7H19_10300 [Aphanothece hegewaldii CCALA 016]